MKKKVLQKLTELFKAINDGYKEEYFFEEGYLIQKSDTTQKFFPQNVVESVNPCSLEEETVYRINTNTILGYAITKWNDLITDF